MALEKQHPLLQAIEPDDEDHVLQAIKRKKEAAWDGLSSYLIHLFAEAFEKHEEEIGFWQEPASKEAFNYGPYGISYWIIKSERTRRAGIQERSY